MRLIYAVLVLVLAWPSFPQAKTQTGDQSPIIKGNIAPVSVIYGITEDKLITELGVTRAALQSFLKILEEKQVTLEELPLKLREIAKNYRNLQAKLNRLESGDLAVFKLKEQASEKVEQGDLSGANEFLQEAKEHDLQAIKKQKDALRQRKLSAAKTATEQGDLKNTELAYSEAALYFQEAAALLATVNKPLIYAKYLSEEGTSWLAAGRYAEAKLPLQTALSIRGKALGPNHPDVARSFNNLALLYSSQGRYADAESHYQRALAIVEKVLGPEHPDVATSLNNLAELYRAQGRYTNAESNYQRALAIMEKDLGPEHPDVAMSLNNLALLYRAQGRYTDAEPHYQRALATVEKVLGPEHPNVATILNNFALLYHDQGRYADAEPHYQRALAIVEKVLGPEHPNVATSLNNLAALYRAQGRYTDAESNYQRALAINEKALGPAHPNTLTILRNYLRLVTTNNREDTAKMLLDRFQALQPNRGWLGIELKSQDDPVGILITQVIRNSPAAQAGLMQDDLIVHFNGHQVHNTKAFVRMVGSLAPATVVDVELVRNGQLHTLSLITGHRPVIMPQ